MLIDRGRWIVKTVFFKLLGELESFVGVTQAFVAKLMASSKL